MKRDYTEILVILDRSGSMNLIREDTIGGFNTFLKGQKDIKVGETLLTLVQFDHECETIWDSENVENIEGLSEKTFIPRSTTSLLDAIGKSVIEKGIKLDKMSEIDKPERVICVIITDGEENSSREFDKARIKEMITHQTNKYNWEFVFIGANQDAISEANGIGIGYNNSLNYTANARGTSAVYNTVTESINQRKTRKASTNDGFFSENDRKKQSDAK